MPTIAPAPSQVVTTLIHCFLVFFVDRIVTIDIPYFLKYYVVVLIAFACPLVLLSNTGEFNSTTAAFRLLQGVWDLMHQTVSLGRMYNVIDISLASPDNEWLCDILLTGFNTMVILMMLNLLIAMIGSSYGYYQKSILGLVLIEKYNMMCAAESVVSEGVLSCMRDKYALHLDADGQYAFEYQQVNKDWVECANSGR